MPPGGGGVGLQGGCLHGQHSTSVRRELRCSMAVAPRRLYMRPLVVRFTDPGVEDMHIDLLYVRDQHTASAAHVPADESVRQIKARVR